ncbi:MAG: hypothetical protein U0T31_08625 [Chitinophagales bacterium]|jgi:hypothetical protein
MKNKLCIFLISVAYSVNVVNAQDNKPKPKSNTTMPKQSNNASKPIVVKSQSKLETIEWILGKFNKYASTDIETNHSNLNDKFAIKYYSWKVKYYDIQYSIDDNYMNIKYKTISFEYNGKMYIQRERITENNILIPIYAITSVYKVDNELAITTITNAIKNEGFYVEGNKKSPFKIKNSYFSIPFSFYEEDDLGERISKAFMNLKKYYSPPTNSETF